MEVFDRVARQIVLHYSDQRQILGDISASPFRGRAVHSDGNIARPSDLYRLTSSPEELVIERHCHKCKLAPTTLNFFDCDSDDDSTDFLHCSTDTGRQSSPSTDNNKKKRSSSEVVDSCWLSKRRRLNESNEAVPLATELQAYSSNQLATTISRLVQAHPELTSEVLESLSVPDLRHMEDKLIYLKRAIYRAFPSFRWETGYNSFSYRRVRVHLDVFKKTCIDQLQLLVASNCCETIIRYVVLAWKYVHQLPNWDDPSHNKVKASCFRHLTVECLAAVSSGSFSCDQLTDIRQQLIRCHRQNAIIAPCIKKIDKLLSDSSVTQ